MTSISKMKHVVVRIALHDGGIDNWRIGRDCANYKVTKNALIFLGDNSEWLGWYNLKDVQMWFVTDHIDGQDDEFVV